MRVDAHIEIEPEDGALVELELSGLIQEEDRTVGQPLSVECFEATYPDGREECGEDLDDCTREACAAALLASYSGQC